MDETTAGVLPESQWTEQQHLIYFLEHHDVACPRCKRSLRGIKDPVCPGCESELVMSIGAESFSYAPWILLLSLSGLCAGLGLFYVMIILEEGWPPSGDLFENVFWVTMWLLFLCIPSPALVYGWRKRMWRCSQAQQWKRGIFYSIGLLMIVVTNLTCLIIMI